MGYAIRSLMGASAGAFLLLAATAAPSHATAVTLTGTETDGRSASATFNTLSPMSRNYLSVVLSNTATYNSYRPTDILTAIFFNLPGNPTLSRSVGISSASLNVGSDIKNAADVFVVGGEWAYKSGVSVGGFNQGISSTGVDLFGPGDRFPGSNLEGPDSPNGGNDNGGLSDKGLIRNSVVFVLGGINAGFDPSPPRSRSGASEYWVR